nr:hypothetical protein [Leucobacter coleopterorum]
MIYNEDFENTVSGSMNLLTSYTSASGLSYTADPPWLINCNGVVLNGFSVGNAPNCGVITDRLRTLSRALGQLRGVANPNTNNSLSAYTDNGSGGSADPGANLIQFATTTPITLPAITGKRYLGFSVDGAVDNYNSNPPQYQFYFVNGANTTAVGAPINAGTDPRGSVISIDGRGIRYGTYATNAAVAVTGNQVGLELRNLVGTGGGNDGAVDNITVLDMTRSWTSRSVRRPCSPAGLPRSPSPSRTPPSWGPSRDGTSPTTCPPGSPSPAPRRPLAPTDL